MKKGEVHYCRCISCPYNLNKECQTNPELDATGTCRFNDGKIKGNEYPHENDWR